ncbi:major capsid protein [Pseudomonas sp. BMS12]|uniref:major capsid protein n=1 Tax=Pseudomonas sp. BMS12 TaxID=1796033 RepID=UPI0009ECD1BE|nr:major capsid protein [Pseudomonas sp. BMS12]
MQQHNSVFTRTRLLVGGVSTAALAFGNAVYAAVPAEATDALDTAKGDVNTIGWAVFAVIVAAAAFGYMRRAL